MDRITLDYRSNYDDLTLFTINVVVDDVVTELCSVVDSESDNDVDQDTRLLTYLTQTNEAISSQSMARMKQTAKKTDEKGQLPAKSPGGMPLAVLPKRSRRFLESDSELKQAANLFGMGSPARSTHSKSPASAHGRSPTRGSPGRSTRGNSPARGAPGRDSPKKGVKPTGGRSNSGRGSSATPSGIQQGEPKPGTSGVRPGQAGYVNRGRGVAGARRSSPRYNLPSFSSDDKEGADDENEEEEENKPEDEDEEEETEIDFLKKDPKNQGANKRPTIAGKNLRLIRAPKRGESGFAIIARWNTTAQQGKFNETKRGWMARPQRHAQNQGIKRAHPGMRALREIRFYQGSTCFLIPMIRFQRAVRQIALDVNGRELRWQARALFALQQAAEAYLVAYLGDANLLAIHARHTTIMKKDLIMVRRMQGRRAIGFDFGDDCGM